MSSCFGLLEVESRDFSQAEKERTAFKAEQIHKMSTIFTQNINLGPPGFENLMTYLNRAGYDDSKILKSSILAK